MVTGGWDSDRNDLDSTEIYRDRNWQLVTEKLSSKIRLTKLITINNRVLLFGNSKNKTNTKQDKVILRFLLNNLLNRGLYQWHSSDQWRCSWIQHWTGILDQNWGNWAKICCSCITDQDQWNNGMVYSKYHHIYNLNCHRNDNHINLLD